MIALILAGGFAKRLWPLTKETPKPLLDVAGRPMIEHIIRKVEKLDVSRIYISTNARFGPAFGKWVSGFKSSKEIRLVVEPTLEEDQKFGAIGGIKFFLDKEDIQDELLVVAGDNMFEDDLRQMLSMYRQKNSPVLGLFDVKDVEEAKRLGIVVLDAENRIIDFVEKSPKPRTTLAATAIYIYPQYVREKIDEYMSDKNNPDAPGFFVDWLRRDRPFFGYVMQGNWFDIGSLEGLELARTRYKG